MVCGVHKPAAEIITGICSALSAQQGLLPSSVLHRIPPGAGVGGPCSCIIPWVLVMMWSTCSPPPCSPCRAVAVRVLHEPAAQTIAPTQGPALLSLPWQGLLPGSAGCGSRVGVGIGESRSCLIPGSVDTTWTASSPPLSCVLVVCGVHEPAAEIPACPTAGICSRPSPWHLSSCRGQQGCVRASLCCSPVSWSAARGRTANRSPSTQLFF